MLQIEALLDPERRKKAAEDQEKLKEVRSLQVARHGPQAKFRFGVARESAALHQIGVDRIAQVIDAVAANQADAAMVALVEQLAEGLALQARYDLAVALLPAGPRKDLYAVRARAIEMVDVQQCDHPLTRATASGEEEATQLLSEQVFNGKQIIRFTECIICRSVSAYA